MQSIIIDYKPNMEITVPCVVRNMPNEVYHAEKGLSNSGLKMLLDCPAKYFYKYLSGEYEPKEKPCFKIGKACHTYILEGKEAFEAKYWHNPYKNMTVDEIKKELDTIGIPYKSTDTKLVLIEKLLWENEIEKKEVELDNNELNQVLSVGNAIFHNQYAKNAFSQKGESELSIFWIDEESGEWMKCRPDFLPYDCVDIPDYKTAQTANPRAFAGEFFRYGYHIQAACYREGVNAIIKHYNLPLDGVQSFFFIVQEKEAPYITLPYSPEMSIVEYGHKFMKQAIEIYQQCNQSGIWTGYSDSIVEISLAPKPDDLIGNFDEQTNICYAPSWIDNILTK